MDKLKDYTIAFKGLSDGKHEFVYHLDDSFFSQFDASLVETGDLKAMVGLLKSQTMLNFSFEIRGKVESVCDKCLGALEIPVRYRGDLLVKFGAEYDEPSEDIIVIPHDEYEINVAQWLYEFICISLPIRHVHKKDKDGNLACDPEMLEKLNQYLVVDKPESEVNDEVDPRWAALKNLVDKNK
ncbi:MAG: YceD family protein [Breznakibacter sp.]